MTNIVIRFATKKDKNLVLKLLDELGEVEDDIYGYSSKHKEAQVLGLKYFEKIVDNEIGKIFVAEIDEKIVGVATFFSLPYIRYGKKRGYVLDFVIDKIYRGKGIGTRLIESIIEYCKQNKIPRLKIDTGLPDAKKFYAKNGGKITSETFTFFIEN